MADHGLAWQAVARHAAAGLALVAPALLALDLPPSATFFNQAAALLGWGAWSVLLMRDTPGMAVPSSAGFVALGAAFALLALIATASPWWTGLPWALALSAAGVIAAAAVIAATGAALRQAGTGTQAFHTFCLAMLVAAMASAGIAIVQVYATSWVDGVWIARVDGGRATGNLRQSNHLSTLLLWGIVATLWLGETRSVRRSLVEPIALVLMFGAVLAASRTGMIGTLFLAAWGLLDKGVSRRTRITLLLAPVAYASLWAAASGWAQLGNQAFVGDSRFSSVGPAHTTRWVFWANLLALIREQPWVGVGSGELNFAWSLTEFPERSGEFFDHAHNLPLHLAVELGLPVATLVLGLLACALWAAGRNAWRAGPGATLSPMPAAFTMLSLMLVHSLSEYPLWYAYFLLPTAFVFGLCLGHEGAGLHANDARISTARGGGHGFPIRAAALMLMFGALFAVVEYFRVVPIFAPPDNARPLADRISAGQRSIFFSHHADYAAATTSSDPMFALQAARRAAHNLLDARLMMAWANALHATGETERAKYIAQRLKEFRNPQSEAYFAPCKDVALRDADKPYQCFAPQRKFTFEDFR